MIARVVTGYNPGGLLRYLFGPGRRQDHHRPRLVATWDGRVRQWQPEQIGPGEFDLDLDSLTAALQAPLRAAGLPVTEPDPDQPEHRRFFRRDASGGTPRLLGGPIWHCSVRNHADDHTLSDADWAHIAAELMHRSGVAPRGDHGGPRWVAVRHDDDGIHLAAVLVRQDTARKARVPHYKRKLREAARAMEERYGLTVTAAADGTAAPAVTRAELEKADRYRQVPARLRLRPIVAQAAATTLDVAGFRRALDEAGCELWLHRLPSGQLRGYSVALRGDVDARGALIYYSGSALAADLTLPKLARRWDQARHGRVPERALDAGLTADQWAEHGTGLVERARTVVATDPAVAGGIAHAAGEVWAALDHQRDTVLGGPSSSWDRAARLPYQPVPNTPRLATEMRWLARGLATTATPTTSSTGTLRLGLALAELALQIAALLDTEPGPRQRAQAARETHHLWKSQYGPPPPPPAATRTATPSQPPQSRPPHPQDGQSQPARPRRRFTPPPPAPPGHGRPPSPPQRGR